MESKLGRLNNFMATVAIIVILSSNATVHAQGISRSKGLGFRLGLWKTARSEALISVSGTEVELSGAGAWMTFFSRFNDDWFYEFHMGAFASVVSDKIDRENFVIETEDVTAIIPFLFGMRYDILSTRSHGGIQPYLGFGVGPYWITNVDAPLNNPELSEVASGLKAGGYLGGGFNIALASFFALNFDMKYHAIDFKFDRDFSGLDFGMGFSIMWGQKREIMRVLGVCPIVNDIYPAYYQFYNLYPLAMVTVKNMTRGPIEVNVRSNIRYFSERPNDSGFVTIEGKETKDIPVTAILGSRIRKVKQRETAVLDLSVEARAGTKITKQLSSSLMVHNTNSWNGEMDKLVFFVTPDNADILEFGRAVVAEAETDQPSTARKLVVAKRIFDRFAEMEFRYQSDPNIPFYKDDRVQFAGETLNLRTGDCDDLVVLYASLLESVGIHTAFVEVQDPEKELAHLYLMFDSGVTAGDGHLVSSNSKRYVIRESATGARKVWVPVETTLIADGFEAAWKVGALSYLQEGELRGGLAAGWVEVIDVE